MSKVLCLLGFAACLWGAAGAAEERIAEGPRVKVGAERLLTDYRPLVAGKRVGIVTNHSAVVGERHLIDLIHDDPEVTIASLYGPEHGLRGKADAGEAVADSRDDATGAPIYSLYGKTRRPTKEMLADVDVLIFDMQDVGARFYTYPATMGRCMISAAEAGIPFIVLDRPNPLGGKRMEGFIREEQFQSGIGMYPTPITHGMTVGELALMIKGEGWHDGLEDLELHVVKMEGWNRAMLWPETGLSWVPPSPNIPDVETAFVYPGTCFFEGTTASEGRGTRQPFLQVGATNVDGEDVAQELSRRNLPGVRLSAVSFVPESIPGMSRDPKLQGENVVGIQLTVTDADALQPVALGIHLLDVFYHALPAGRRDDFFNLRGMSIRAGNKQIQQLIEKSRDVRAVVGAWGEDIESFARQREPYLLYH